MSKTKALIYCRVSSLQQVKDGHGIEGQEHKCKQYAKYIGYKYEKSFYDKGVSGGILERPGIKELIKYIDDNIHNNYVVIIDDISRLARDVRVHLELRAQLKSRGAKLECPSFKFDDSEESELLEIILSGVAQYGRTSNRKKVIDKQMARLEKGYWPFGRVPYSYKYQKTQEHGQLLFPKERESKIVAECLEKFSDGVLTNHSEMRVFLQEKDLYGDGRDVKKGLPERLLINASFYAGYIEFKKWEVDRRKGHHQAIISDETLDKIEIRLNIKPPRKLCKNKSDIFPLRKLIKCGCCAIDFTSSSPTNGSGNKVFRYTCNNPKCQAKPKNIEPDILHGEYIKLLTLISPEKEIIELSEVIARDIWNRKEQEVIVSQKDQEKQINLIEQEIERCVDLATNTRSDVMREKYEMKVETLEKQKNELGGKFDFLNDVNFENALECVMDFVGTPAKYWQKSGVENKRKIHGLIFPEGLSYDAKNGFGTVKKALPFNINEALCGPKDRQVEMAGVEPASRLFFNYRLHV